MQIINNITYPILNFFGYPVLWEHPLFGPIMEKTSVEEAVQHIPGVGKQFLDVNNKYGKKTQAWRTKEKITPERRKEWPLLSLSQKDFRELGRDTVMGIDNGIVSLWGLYFHKKVPEVVTPDVWDKICNNDDEESYRVWLNKDEITIGGVLLFPFGKWTTVFYYSSDNEKPVAIVMNFMMSQLVAFYANGAGFFSSDLNPSEILFVLSKERGITLSEAYFQQSIYNVLRYYHYVYVLGKGNTKILHRGDAETFHGMTYKSTTDTPLLFVTN